jgi:8-oxo-dGTP diphosphatase
VAEGEPGEWLVVARTGRTHLPGERPCPRGETPIQSDSIDLSENVRVVAAVVRRGGRLLICERPAHKRHGGLWEFPGGKMEPGETVLTAVHRELAEELGVEAVGVGEALGVVHDPGSPFSIEFYPVEIRGEPECREHSRLEWVEPTELARFPLAPSDRLFVAAWREGANDK